MCHILYLGAQLCDNVTVTKGIEKGLYDLTEIHGCTPASFAKPVSIYHLSRLSSIILIVK
jgi:hypothetical protein